MNPRLLFEGELALIDKVIGFVCRRHRLHGDEAEDFASFTKLQLLANDYAVFRKFQGKSSLQTYLTTVIHRLFLDYQTRKWGKWRPSSKARRLGPVAVKLDTLLSRDG